MWITDDHILFPGWNNPALVENAARGMSALEGAEQHTSWMYSAFPWRILNWKNHWPGKQFRLPRLAELLWHKWMQDSNIVRRDKQSSSFQWYVTTFHWSFRISGIYLARQLILIFLVHFEFQYFSRDIQEGKNLKNTCHQQLRILQDGRDAAQEDNAHCTDTF